MGFGLVALPYIGGLFNPYFGGFGYFKTPAAGAGLAYPGFNFPIPLRPVSYLLVL